VRLPERRPCGLVVQRLWVASLVVALAAGAAVVPGSVWSPAEAAPPAGEPAPPAAAAGPHAPETEGDDAGDAEPVDADADDAGDAEPVDEEPAEPEPTPEEVAYEQALDRLAAALRELGAARAAQREATSAGNRADGALRGGEEAVVGTVVARLEAADEVARAEDQLRHAMRRLQRAETQLVEFAVRAEAIDGELERARVQLEERVIRAYKTGSLGYEASLPLTLLREASSPSELATAVKHLAALMADGLEQVDGLVAELADLEVRTAETEAELLHATGARDEATALVAEARAALEAQDAAVAEREARAATLRAAAYAAEEGLIGAVDAVDRARSALATADAEAVAAAALVETRPRTHEELLTEGAAPGEEAEASGWDARRRALRRARSLPAEDRYAAADWICPVPGGRFINDWGFPRAPNRRHEGTDVFAPTGTPVLAPTDAVVVQLDATDRFDGRRDLGGVTVTLERDRHRYYLAHLDAIEPDLAVGDELAAGTLVGWVGRTGNARTTPPHLHLGWYVDRVAVNPYVSLAVACREDASPSDAPPADTPPPGLPPTGVPPADAPPADAPPADAPPADALPTGAPIRDRAAIDAPAPVPAGARPGAEVPVVRAPWGEPAPPI
jgi:murein DD-endopeptidase MepM/ murein hydrolase activator NlpD